MAWRLAPSVQAALAEATRRWPHRSKASDGTIGDAAHAARQSDHNPDARGIVHAFDITNDPMHGVDCEQLAAYLVSRRDHRVKYIIWNHRICKASNWLWGPYTGPNPHTKHMHVSIKDTADAEGDTSEWWGISLSTSAGSLPPGFGPALPPVPDEVNARASALLQSSVAIGAMVPLTVAARDYLLLVEFPVPDHFKGLQRGVTLYERKLVRAIPPALAPGHNLPPPAGYRVASFVPPAVKAKADEILRMHVHAPDQYPLGSQFPIPMEGKDYLFALEWHKHAATDPVAEGLKRWHHGVTVYVRDP